MKSHLLTDLRTLNRYLLVWLVCWLCLPSVTWALTAANTLIRNQASATFKDDTGTTYNVTSNVVETLVQQVAGLQLEQSQGKLGSAGSSVEFPHVLTNTGNGDDRFNLVTAEVSSDTFDFSQVILYADTNQDGQADNLNSPITATPLLKAGESFAFVAVAKVPGSVVDGNAGQFTLTGSSAFTPSAQASNTDTVTVTTRAILDVVKSISATAGKAGSGNYTVTLSYRNTSLVNASNVVLIDALPAGMNYVAGSARWSETGATVLTDASPSDVQGSVATLRYCAYDSSCTGVPEASRDADTDTTNQVTAIMGEVMAGSSGELRFEVSIASGLTASSLINKAEYEFYDGTATSERYITNAVQFTVEAEPGVITNGSATSAADLTGEPVTVASVAQKGTAVFGDYVWNTGNATDSFDITVSNDSFPAGTVFTLYQTDGETPLLDTNGNGIPDTGPLAADAVYKVVLKARLPASQTGTNGGAGYEATLLATSFRDTSYSNPAINHLGSITGSTLDLTNNAAIGQSGVTGTGAGPEAAAVTTRNVMPGNSVRFILYINNTSAVADSFDLLASTDSTFAKRLLPANWAVRFVDNAGNTLTNTGSIAAGASKRVFAEVSVPDSATAEVVDLYFRAVSPVTGAGDSKHDAVAVGEVTDVVLYPDNAGQVLPGGTVVYSHWLVNQGNVDKSGLTLTVADDSDGWQTVLYADTDGNGVLSGGDDALSTVASLPAGESVLVFAKVFAAATIPLGGSNVTIVTAAWDGGASSTFALDVTTTNASSVVIRKAQALDALCDGTEDFAFSYEDFPAEPGQCILYQLTATNSGAESVQNVRIQDATPAYTSFITTGGLPALSQGTLATPVAHGGRGKIIGAMGMLAAGDSATLTFGIKIE